MKSQEERIVHLIPDDTWGGAGMLGVTIRLDNYAGAEERLVRVLEVESPQSPAAMAGLVPFHDYILGTTSETLQDTAQLGEILQESVDRVVELYVYNSQSDMVRNVALMPTLSWGGPGLLGAAVGTGYLHRFPAKTQGTTGASVERKVRYIGTSPTKSSSNPSSANSAQQNLELEPQLEMEVPSDSESDREETVMQSKTWEQQSTAATANPNDERKEVEQQQSSSQQVPPLNAQEQPQPVDDSGTAAAALFAGPPPPSTAD